MTDAGVTASRGIAIACGVLLLAAALAWAAVGVDAADLRAALGLSDARAAAAAAAPAPAALIRANLAAMDEALRRQDRAGYADFYVDPAQAAAALAAIGPAAAAATELLDLLPEGAGFRERARLTLTAPPGAGPPRRVLAVDRLWLPDAAGRWRAAAVAIRPWP